jgi:crossover junction endodeoxyribonuclease RuvC
LTKCKRILGIDPGTAVTGYGLIECSASGYTAIDYGCIRIPAKLALPDRYYAIFECLEQLMGKYAPHEVAIETQFVQKNPQSALKIGMARGVAIIAARKAGAAVFEYAPCRAKKAVTGSGSSAKEHVQRMIQSLLRLPQPPKPYDAADALALAICHAHQLQRGTPL